MEGATKALLNFDDPRLTKIGRCKRSKAPPAARQATSGDGGKTPATQPSRDKHAVTLEDGTLIKSAAGWMRRTSLPKIINK